MTDSEKIAEQDQRLIAIEKNGTAVSDRVKQNAKDIRRVEEQTTERFEHLVNLMNAGFTRVEKPHYPRRDDLEGGYCPRGDQYCPR